MEIKNILYNNLDTAIDAYYEVEDCEIEENIIKEESIGDDAILTTGPAWRVLDKNLICLEGVYCNYNEETEEFEPDWALTLIYDNVSDELFDVNKYNYFEQDPPMTTIHNYMQIIKPDTQTGKTKIA